ncbi:unnamed protein product [Rhodiola kirilowii]
MKSIATCYSEHAIKISNSYCSGPKPSLSQNLIPSVQNSVTSLYKSRIIQNEDDDQIISTSLTWTNNLIGRGFNVQIVYKSITSSDQLRKSKGSKNIMLQPGSRIEVKWDLSNADYDNGPEPTSNFYVTVSLNSNTILLLGDYEEHSMSPGYATFSLISRTESFSGCGVYSTKAQFCSAGKTHDIMIKCGREEDGLKVKDPILTVSVDRRKVVIVKKLQWNFRGNQCIFVDGIVVDMMWDVHDWLFNPVSGNGLFLFRSRSGFDSRLWLEKEKSCKEKEEDKVEFSLLVTACTRHPH